jgi:hypothetical protein
MKYILMMMGSKADFEWFTKWSKEELQAYFTFMKDFNKELKESGVLVAAEGLAFPDEAKIVRAGKNGEPITDGVFPESKEFLAGFWIVDVESPEQAYQIAARASAAPGPRSRTPVFLSNCRASRNEHNVCEPCFTCCTSSSMRDTRRPLVPTCGEATCRMKRSA